MRALTTVDALELISSIGVDAFFPERALARRATRRVAGHAQGAQRSQRPFWEEPGGSGLFGRIAA